MHEGPRQTDGLDSHVEKQTATNKYLIARTYEDKQNKKRINSP